MNIIFFFFGSSVLMALGFLVAFFWAQKSGQNEDLHTPAMRILWDDESPSSTDDMNQKPS